MAVTTQQFQAMAPVPYQQARTQLRTGDILLFSSKGGFSELIERFTDSVWSHAAFIWNMENIDRLLLLESVETFGVRAIALSNRINGSSAAPEPYDGKLLAVRHKQFPNPAPDDKVGAMTRFAIDRLGYPYGALEVAKIGLRIAAGLVNYEIPGDLEPGNSFICSEYVAKCHAAMDIILAPDKEGFIAPADIAADPNIEAVVSICPDPPASGA